MPESEKCHFPVNQKVCYLNHAAVAPWSQATTKAVQNFAQENCELGATDYPRWLQTENQLRQRLATLLNADSIDEIALVKNTSEGLSFIAAGIDWQPGDEIVITQQEFPSNRIVWESLAGRGVRIVEVDVSDFETATDRICDQISNRTRLTSISSVQFASGLSVDLVQIGQRCQNAGSLFCIDAIQSLGVIPMDCQKVQADFVVADGHKWLLGPEGLGVLYIRKKRISELAITEFGWHMVKDRGNYDIRTWEPAQNAQRFECGSPNMIGAYALNTSVGELLEVGIESVQRLVLQKTRLLMDMLSEIPGCLILSPHSDDLRAGIVTFKFRDKDHGALHRSLMSGKVICAHRGGGIRFSPHFHTPDAKLEAAVDAVRALI